MYTKLMQILAFVCLLCASTAAIGQVTADFSANVTASCSPLVVRFTDQSSGNITSWKWSFGNNNVSTQQNPGAVYLQPGMKDVSLIVSDGITYDTLVMPSFIEVYQDPQADLEANITTGCTPFDVCFSDITVPGSGNIVSWLWDFGDGTSSTDQAPCITYSNPGSYTVTLLVKDDNGCESQITYPNLIEAADTLHADFTSDVNASCEAPLLVRFTNTSSPSNGLTYLWDFDFGPRSLQKDPALRYTTDGLYTVKLIATNSFGCKDTMTKVNFIAVEPLTADFTSDVTIGCVGTPVSFTDLSTSNPNTWFWDFGDGGSDTVKNPIHTYNTAGTYTVHMFAANSGSCSDSIVKTSYITISEAPAASFAGDNLSACAVPHTVNFTDASVDAVSWFWDFGDGNTSTLQNPSHTYTDDTTGTFSVTLTVTGANGCANTTTMNDLVAIIPPAADFAADTLSGCLPLQVQFSDSSVSGQSIVSWFWDFGDGNTSTLQNPTHTYTDPDVFDVSLVIVNNEGCTDTIERNSYVRAGNKPTSDLSVSTRDLCLFGSVNFMDQSTSNANQWLWYFGDGNTSADQNPTYAYSDTGIFTITLIAMSNGCRDTIVKPDYIHIAPPDAKFGVHMSCDTPYTVEFTDISLAPDNWLWSFGDGTTSNLQNPVHTFATRGRYTVTLTVEDTTSGCYDIEALEVWISDPVADFYSDTLIGCYPLSVTFQDTSIDPQTYFWETAGMTSTEREPQFVYTTPGIYDVTLIITDVHGCTDTLVRPDYITVLGPTAEFGATPTAGCAPLFTELTDSSTTFMSSIVAWTYDMGNGDSLFTQNPSYTYQQTGTYTVKLTVEDGNGCFDTRVRSRYIKPSFPKPDFTGDTLSCISGTAEFINTSTGNGVNYLWDFGDGMTSVDADPIHYYDSVGTYTITLTVTDLNGCDSTIVRPDFVTISDPVANFYADNTFSPCPPLVVGFHDSSTNDIVSWFWDFGDGSTSTLKDPSHVYLTPGNFTVSLITETAKGCSDTSVQADLVVVLGPTGTFSFTPQNGCLGNEVEFDATTQNTMYHTWDYGDGIVEDGPEDTTHIYSTTGVNYPVLILDDGQGCILAITNQDSVVIGEMSTEFTASTNYLCKSGDVSFTDQSSGFPAIQNYMWLFGDGDTSSALNPTHTYTTPGVYDVTLITDNGHCFDTLVKPGYIVIDGGPQAGFSMSAQTGCMPHKVSFQDTTVSDSTVVSWFWDFGNGQVDSVANTTATYTAAGDYPVTLIVTSISGCIDTLVDTITVFPLPTVSSIPDTTICFGDTIQLVTTGANTYSWNPATGLDTATNESPWAFPINDTEFIVTGTDTNGCINVDTVAVSVNPIPAASAGPDREICLGQPVELNGSGGGQYDWWPTADLNSSMDSTVVATPDTTTNYILVVTNSFKCTDTDTVKVTVRALPEGILTADTAICDGQAVQLNAAGGTTYNWGPTVSLNCIDCDSPIAKPDTTTMYVLDVVNQYGCIVQDSVTIEVNPNPVVTITGEIDICQGAPTQLEATGGVTYNWVPSSGLDCMNCADPIASPDTTTTYTLVVGSSFGCTTTAQHSISVRPIPVLSTIDDATICKGDNIQLTTEQTYADQVTWTPVDGLNNAHTLSPIATPEVTTTYTVTAVSEYGCEISRSVTVKVISKVIAEVSNDMDICFGDSVQLSAQVNESGYRGYQVVWNPINDLTAADVENPIASPDASTLYTMIAYSGKCIPDTHQVNVTVHQLPELSAGEVMPVVENTPIQLQVDAPDNVVSYSWSPATGLNMTDVKEPIVNASQSETYNLTVVDEFGCENNIEVPINVVGSCGDDLFVPNTFSPNRDGKNDKLYVRGRGIIGLEVFRVFDRWGNLVFETNDINQGWDGVYKGKMMHPAVFVYYYQAVCSNGFVVSRKGNVTLIR